MSKNKNEVKKITIRPIKKVNIGEYCRDVMLIHGANVNLARAIPDVRDSLKPVERRALYTMFKNLKITPNSNFIKVARIVGEILGLYHPRLGGF